MSNKIDDQVAIISSNETLISNLKENVNLLNDCTSITLEKTRHDFEEQIKALTIENLEFKSLLESNSNVINQLNNNFENLKLKNDAEQNNLKKHFHKSLKKLIEDADEKQKIIETEKLKLEHNLNEAKTQIVSLKEQIRPIG